MENRSEKIKFWLLRIVPGAVLVAASVILFYSADGKDESERTGYVEPVKEEASGRFGDEEWKKFSEYGDKIIDQVLIAYNNGNYDDFVKHFSTKRRAITPRSFAALWEGDYKGKFGEFVSKEFFKEKSNPVRNFPLLTYRAVFEKNGDIGIRCVFTMDDDGVYRIFYLRFDPYQDLFY
ncbi:MAG TPA: hypothetical protein PKZ41_02715 [Candidatus Omnitrophota bacterium]|nr:hypothetical protein [Candidatus Omnitrophota bacterium]